MTSRARARAEIDDALLVIDRARARAQRLVDALARDEGESSSDAIAHLIRACASDAADVDAATRSIGLLTSTAIARSSALASAAMEAVKGTALEACARGCNARGALETRVETLNGDVVVVAVAPRVFECSWRLTAPEDAGTTTAKSTDGTTSLAHEALGDRLRERAVAAREGKKGEVSDEDVAVKMLEWLEEMHDVFTRPDELSGGRVLAADRTRGGVLIPGRLLPGR